MVEAGTAKWETSLVGQFLEAFAFYAGQAYGRKLCGASLVWWKHCLLRMVIPVQI